MNPENEPNFEKLKSLLKLKRHEMPPPGTFDRFSRSVIQKLQKAPPARPSFLDTWQQVMNSLFRPKWALGLTVLVILGVVTLNWRSPDDADQPGSTQLASSNQFLIAKERATNSVGGTNRESSIFDRVQSGAEPASYRE